MLKLVAASKIEHGGGGTIDAAFDFNGGKAFYRYCWYKRDVTDEFMYSTPDVAEALKAYVPQEGPMVMNEVSAVRTSFGSAEALQAYNEAATEPVFEFEG